MGWIVQRRDAGDALAVLLAEFATHLQRPGDERAEEGEVALMPVRTAPPINYSGTRLDDESAGEIRARNQPCSVVDAHLDISSALEGIGAATDGGRSCAVAGIDARSRARIVGNQEIDDDPVALESVRVAVGVWLTYDEAGRVQGSHETRHSRWPGPNVSDDIDVFTDARGSRLVLERKQEHHLPTHERPPVGRPAKVEQDMPE